MLKSKISLDKLIDRDIIDYKPDIVNCEDNTELITINKRLKSECIDLPIMFTNSSKNIGLFDNETFIEFNQNNFICSSGFTYDKELGLCVNNIDPDITEDVVIDTTGEVDYSLLINKINTLKNIGLFPTSFTPSFILNPNKGFVVNTNTYFYHFNNDIIDNFITKIDDFKEIEGYTDDKLSEVQTFSFSQGKRYLVGFNRNKEYKSFFTGVTDITFTNKCNPCPGPTGPCAPEYNITGPTGPFFPEIEKINYVLDSDEEIDGIFIPSGISSGLVNTPPGGIKYETYFCETRTIDYGRCMNTLGLEYESEFNIKVDILNTKFIYTRTGIQDNYDLKSLVFKEEYLHMAYPSQVFVNFDIDRGDLSPVELYNRLSEIENTEQSDIYNNNFFKNVKING